MIHLGGAALAATVLSSATIALAAAALSDRITIGIALVVIAIASALQLALVFDSSDGVELDAHERTEPCKDNRPPASRVAVDPGARATADSTDRSTNSAVQNDPEQADPAMSKPQDGSSAAELAQGEKPSSNSQPSATRAAATAAVALAGYRQTPSSAQRPQCPRCGRSTVARTEATGFRCTCCHHTWIVTAGDWPLTIGNPSVANIPDLTSKENQQ